MNKIEKWDKNSLINFLLVLIQVSSHHFKINQFFFKNKK